MSFAYFMVFAFALGVGLLIIGSMDSVIGQSGLPAPGTRPSPIPNSTIVAPNSSGSTTPPNALQTLPKAPF